MEHYLHEAWAQRGRLFGAILVLTSMSAAHYAGFVAKLPLDLVTAFGSALALGAAGPFALLVILSLGFTKVAVGILQLYIPPFMLLVDRWSAGRKKKLSWSEGRKFIRSHHRSLQAEPYAWWIFQAIIFLTLFLGFYVQFSLGIENAIFILLGTGIACLIVLLRSGFFYRPKITEYLGKLRKRQRLRARFFSSVFVVIALVLVILSYAAGYERMRWLTSQPAQQITNKYFSGYARYLMNSGGVLLVLENSGNDQRYLLFSPEFAMGIERNPQSFPLAESIIKCNTQPVRYRDGKALRTTYG